MKRVGLTGGIGCGKSTVMAEFARLGVPCFQADEAGHRVYEDMDFRRDLQSLLGDSVFLPDGSVDRRAVAARVFGNRQLLDDLNGIVHPRVMASFDAFCRDHADCRYVMFESAILYETGLDRQMDSMVCVYLALEDRLQRLMSRDHTSREALLKRVANQLPAEEVMMRADYVVLNYEGNPRKRQVEWIDKQLKR